MLNPSVELTSIRCAKDCGKTEKEVILRVKINRNNEIHCFTELHFRKMIFLRFGINYHLTLNVKQTNKFTSLNVCSSIFNLDIAEIAKHIARVIFLASEAP